MNKIIIDLEFVKHNLINEIDRFLKNNLCEKCKISKQDLILYPNGNYYCKHNIKICNKIFNNKYKKMAYLMNLKFKNNY